MVGCVKRLFSFTFSRLPFKSDRTQVSSSIHTLWVLDAVYNMKYLCGNIIMVRIYWQWQRCIRASLFVPQDERVFLSLAPEALWTMSWLNVRPHVRANSGHVWIMLSVSETMKGGWIQREERIKCCVEKVGWSFVNLRMLKDSSLVLYVWNGNCTCNWHSVRNLERVSSNQITENIFSHSNF